MGCYWLFLLLRVTAVVAVDAGAGSVGAVDGMIFTKVLDNLARDSLGIQDIQVRGFTAL